jgi:hypothetical protein
MRLLVTSRRISNVPCGIATTSRRRSPEDVPDSLDYLDYLRCLDYLYRRGVPLHHGLRRSPLSDAQNCADAIDAAHGSTPRALDGEGP